MQQFDDHTNTNKKLILFDIVLITFMSTLDTSIINVAMPNMVDALSTTTQLITWVVTIYLIVISSTILIFGRLGDLKGLSKVFTYGIGLFTFGSALCGLSGSLMILLVARMIQGLGAAATMATSYGLITQIFPINERGKALGISGTFVAIGSMTGPTLGGFIVGAFSWHYIFLINIPFGILGLILAIKVLPKSVPKAKEKLDIKGALLFALTIIILFFSLSIGGTVGYTQPVIILCLSLSLILFVAFLLIEKKDTAPLLQLSIFKSTLFSLSIFCGFISFIAIGSFTIIQPFYLENAMNLSPSMTGLAMIVYPLFLSVVSPISGYLSDKIGSKMLTFLGLTLLSFSLFLMSSLTETSPIWRFIIFVIIMAIGNGLFQAPNNALVMSSVPEDKIGIAGSINSLVRNIGVVFGVTMSTNLLYLQMSNKIGYPVSDFVKGRPDVFIFGMKSVYLSVAFICAVGAIITAIRFFGKKRTI
ncbi:MFS transporter [Acetobacterium tundrae]|uniref:DHA2 family efflux MFS transporter permease subunit n=1 Tax=Acetobacterium tundrae TaxID=132932 RepID=A0ABR6WK18_9FIRM|nr:MFS transporter [Acetobacterium tundrae]MBC3796495.1 DHA2 family efflux MFS transporter permease subunit [Acetobacterium tundrae]